jgi:hypothetical protein
MCFIYGSLREEFCKYWEALTEEKPDEAEGWLVEKKIEAANRVLKKLPPTGLFLWCPSPLEAPTIWLAVMPLMIQALDESSFNVAPAVTRQLSK